VHADRCGCGRRRRGRRRRGPRWAGSARAGHGVVVYNRTAPKASAWVGRYGGASAPTPREAAAGRDFVLACVGNDGDLRAVALGPDGAFAGMKPGAIFIDHTTASATVAREIYAAAKARGVRFLDAPVSGGQAGAENGKLTIMVGGEPSDFERARALLEAMGRLIVYVGEPGDPEDNPTLAWPETRKHFTAGTLTITEATPQQKGVACEPINFDPLVMADGIAPTNDPILRFRSPAYAVSFVKRLSNQ